ncbi:MAG: Gfo/Idh/MocA family oxidoreductase [Candidatus Binatia bacterium]
MTIRWGIIGCGDVTEVKSGPGFQKARGSELIAVMRRTGRLAEDYAKRHGISRWYDNADALISDPEIDAIYIATPPGSHLEYALKVCDAGKPVYVEKPMARNFDECRQMVDSFRSSGLKLFVAYYRRALPRFLKVKEIVALGLLGTVTTVAYRYAEPEWTINPDHFPWRLGAAQSGGGIFFDMGCHALDILDFILGPLIEVSGTASNRALQYDVEDTVSMQFRTEAGIQGVASWDFASSTSEDHIKIKGTHGLVSLSVFGNEPVRLERAEVTEIFELPNPKHIQQPLIQTIVDDLLGKGQCPSRGESGARTAKVMDKVVEGYYGSRASGFWDRIHSWPGRRKSNDIDPGESK